MKKLLTSVIFFSFCSAAIAQPEINVRGNGNTIIDGDATPSFSDWTEYISILVCTGTVVRSYTIENIGTVDLNISSVTLTGPEAGDFTITGFPASAIIPGGSSVLQITCNPLAVGQRNATITINSDDADESVYDYAIRGTGNADVVNPTISCPANINANAAAGLCSAIVTYSAPTASDNCPSSPTVTQIAGLPSGSAFPVGVTVNTFQATDGSGNSSTCSFSVTVTDAQAPVLYTMSTVASSNASGGAYSDGWQNGDNDGTGFGAWTLNASTGNTAQAGFVVASSITNGSGIDSNGDQDINSGGISLGMYANSAQATQATRSFSTPLIVGRSFRMEFDNGAVDNGQIVGFQLQNSSGNSLGEIRYRGGQAGYEIVDNNGITPFGSIPFTDEGIVIEVTPAAVGVVSLRLTRKVNGATQTLTSISFPGGGNQTIARFMVFNSNAGTGMNKYLYVNNLSVSVASAGCPSNIAVNNAVGQCGATVTYSQVLASDNCNSSIAVTQTSGLASGAVFPVGTTTNSFSVTDAAGNTSTCSFSVTVTDATPPVTICNNPTLYLNASGSVNVIAAMMDGGSSDNCGIASRSINVSSFNCANLGSNNVILTVTDAAGNSSGCTGVVTVLDSTRPVITVVPGPQTVIAGAGCTALVPDLRGLVSSTDNCGVSSSVQVSPVIGSGISLGATVPVTIVVTDASGNSRSCTFNLSCIGSEIDVLGNSISIVDGDTSPSVTDDTDFGNVASCSGSVTHTFTIQTLNSAVDLSGISVMLIGNVGDFTLTTAPPSSVTWAMQTATFQITFDPQSVGFTNAVVNVFSNDCDESLYNFAISGVGTGPEMDVKGNLNIISDGDVTPSITDHTDFGSVLTCTGTILRTYTIENTGNSVLNVGIITITGANAADFSLNLGAGPVVNPGGSTIFRIMFNPLADGLRTATININNDDCNESPYNFSIQGTGLADVTPPVASCQNISVYLNPSGNASIVPAQIDNGSADNCGIVSRSLSVTNFSCANIGANNVTLTVTDGSGNSSNCTGVVTVLDSVRPVAVAQNVTVTLSGGTATVTAAAINNGSSDACGIASMTVSPNAFTCANLGANTVTLTVTDVNGNSRSTTAIVTVLNDMVATAAMNVSVSCYGGSNGQASANITGGAGPFTYAWSPSGGTNAVATGLAAGTYTCIITDAGGCTASSTVSITEPSSPVVSSVTSDAILCNGGNATATVTASGGTAPYAGTGTFTVTATTYTFTVTDALGCVSTSTLTLTEPAALVASTTSTPILCNGGTSTITVSATGGTPAYSGTGTFTVSAGTTNYTVTDANGCTSGATVTVTEPAALVAGTTSTPILCNGGTSTITVSATGGTPAYNGTGTFTVSAGTTNYTVTDANGCTSGASVTITEPAALVASTTSTPILCNGGTSTITVSATGGTPAYSGTGTFTVTAGSPSYIVTDANGCTSTTSITVTEPTALVPTISSTPVLCNGGNSIVTVAVTGGTPAYTGDGNFTVTAGTYNYTVTDANGCTGSASITVTEPTALMASSAATSILCNGGSATVTVTATGGTPVYSGDGNFTAPAGTHNYTVSDANGCTSTTTITITEPTLLTAGSSATMIACNGGTATVTVSASGGTPAYSGDGNFTVPAGTHNYTVTDANGCTTTTSIVVTEPTAISTSVVVTDVLCNGDATGAIDLTVTGGTLPYTFDWNSGTFTTEDLVNVPAGTYSGVLTDANGCTDSGVITITEPPVLTATVASQAGPTTCAGTDGTIDITVNGGTAAYAYLWSNSATSEDLTGVAAGAYSCDITDANGCTTSINTVLNDPNAPTVTLALAMDTICFDDAAFTLSGESPAGGTFTGPGVSGGNFSPSVAGVGLHVISYNYTDISGCSASAVDSIYVDLCLSVQANQPGDEFMIYPNPNNGTFTIRVSNTETTVVQITDATGKLIESRQLQPAGTEQFTIESAGMYCVTAIAADGSRTSQRVVITR